jgi:hypothetical protein
VDLADDRLGDLPGPRVEDQHPRLVGQRLRAEQAGERGEQDQEREQRRQGRERDVARDRPAVVGDEALRRHAHDLKSVAEGFHDALTILWRNGTPMNAPGPARQRR